MNEKINDSMIRAFKKYLQNEEKSAATLEKYVHDITVFKQWCQNRALDKSLILAYKQEIMERYAPASVNAVLSSLNSFFSFNEWYELKVKTLKIQKRIFANEDKELSKAEYERLLIVAKRKKNRRLYYLMQTICSTGIRVSELRFITAEAVDRGQAVINCKGKMRVVILPKQLCHVLKQYLAEIRIAKGPIFVSRNGVPLNRSNIWTAMKKLCEEAGVSRTKVFPHNLRHLFARTYYFLQKDIVRLADILGHSSINTTRIYTMESGEVHKKQIESLGLVFSRT